MLKMNDCELNDRELSDRELRQNLLLSHAKASLTTRP